MVTAMTLCREFEIPKREVYGYIRKGWRHTGMMVDTERMQSFYGNVSVDNYEQWLDARRIRVIA